MRYLVVFLLIVSLTSGCSLMKPKQAVPIASTRQLLPENIKFVELKISRAEYKARLLNGGGTNKARLIEVFQGGYESEVKEYRFFDVQPGSLFDLVGIQTADILIAASGYVVPDQETFWRYLNLVKDHKTAEIEIRRSGVPMLIKITFID